MKTGKILNRRLGKEIFSTKMSPLPKRRRGINSQVFKLKRTSSKSLSIRFKATNMRLKSLRRLLRVSSLTSKSMVSRLPKPTLNIINVLSKSS
jgi:hypothetical protein